MAPDANDRPPALTIVGATTASPLQHRPPETEGTHANPRGLDWSLFMARAQEGDRAAYRRLLEDIARYLHALGARRLKNPTDVEDVVQEILLTVHAMRHTYDPARPFGPWLVAIANRRIIDALRRQGRAVSRETALESEHETFGVSEANLPEAGSDRHVLWRAIETLPPGQRQAIRLLKLQEMSLKEAAAASGMSIAALKVATHRAVKSLRKMLGRKSDKT
jgi:RNA polymerase sigma factor (sigma-70 family)